MHKQLVMAGVCLSVAVAAPVAGLAAAKPANPLVQQSVSESMKNEALKEAVKEGRVARTPESAKSWHLKEAQRREMQERAAAKRLEILSGSHGDQTPGQAQ